MKLSAALIASALVLGVAGQRYEGGIGDFYYPDEEGIQFWKGDIINITYGCNYTKPELFMDCTHMDPEAEGGFTVKKNHIARVPPRENFYLFEFDYEEDTECWFNMLPDRDGTIKDEGFASLPFGAWMIPRGEQTRRESQPTPTSTPTSDRETAATTNSAATTSAGSADEDTGGLGTGAQIGVGVGVSCGGLGLIAVAVGFWLIRRRRAKADKNQLVEEASTNEDPGGADAGFVKPKAELEAPLPPVELDAMRSPAELDSPKSKVELVSPKLPVELYSPKSQVELDSPQTLVDMVSPLSPVDEKSSSPPAELPA